MPKDATPALGRPRTRTPRAATLAVLATLLAAAAAERVRYDAGAGLGATETRGWTRGDGRVMLLADQWSGRRTMNELTMETTMQAFRAAAVVGTASDLHLTHVPFRPGSVVEVIVLEPPSEVSGARPRELTAEREAALDRLFQKSYSLGGKFPARDDLHER